MFRTLFIHLRRTCCVSDAYLLKFDKIVSSVASLDGSVAREMIFNEVNQWI